MLSRTLMSSPKRDAVICRPSTSVTRVRFSALFNSKVTLEVLSSGMKVTFAVALRVCAVGLICASSTTVCTSILARACWRSWAKPVTAIMTANRAPAVDRTEPRATASGSDTG